MELAFTTNFLSGSGDFSRPLADIAEAGFSHLLWNHHGTSDFAYGKHELTALKKMLKENSLKIHDIHGSCNADKSWFSETEYLRRAGVDLVINRLEMLNELEASGVLVMHQPRISTYMSEEEIAHRRKSYDSIRRSLDELVPLLEKTEKRIALECMPGDTWEFLTQLLADYPAKSVGLCFDCGHANLNFRKYFDDVKKHSDRIIAIHLHDNDGLTDMHLTPFMGTANWNEIAEILINSPYRGPLTFESHMTGTPFFVKGISEKKQPREAIRDFLADSFRKGTLFGSMCGR